MPISDFVQKAMVENLAYVADLDYDNQKIKLSFEDGSFCSFSFDEWFNLLETAITIININQNLSQKK